MKLKPLKQLGIPLLVSIVTALIFLTYMVLVGVPKTAAANYYNLAVVQEGLGAEDLAKQYFELAIQSYPEAYIVKDYQRFLGN